MTPWRRPDFALAFALLLVLLAPRPASAQFDASLLKATSTLTSTQQNTIDQYVKHWMDQLATDDDDKVVEARGKLVDPLQMGGGDVFNSAYHASLARNLPGAMAAEKPMGRLNALVVANAVKDPAVTRVAEAALADPNAAVRYAAAKVINTVLNPDAAGKVVLDDAAQKLLLDDLIKALAKETSPDVMRKIMTAVAKLTILEADPRLLDALNQRVTLHRNNPELALQPEIEAIRELHQKIVKRRVGNQAAVADATLRTMALASFRYLALSGAMLETGKLAPERAGECWTMIENSEVALRFAVGQLAPKQPLPPEIKDLLPLKKLTEINLRTEKWREILLAPPFDFKGEELK